MIKDRPALQQNGWLGLRDVLRWMANSEQINAEKYRDPLVLPFQLNSRSWFRKTIDVGARFRTVVSNRCVPSISRYGSNPDGPDLDFPLSTANCPARTTEQVAGLEARGYRIFQVRLYVRDLVSGRPLPNFAYVQLMDETAKPTKTARALDATAHLESMLYSVPNGLLSLQHAS